MGRRSRLRVAVGYDTAPGKRPDNQDYVGVCTPTGATMDVRGVVAAVADGVAGGRGGRVAAELTVRQFMEGYYGLPRTLAVAKAAGRALSTINDWLYAQNQHDGDLQGAATTFSGLIFLRSDAWVVHVGDTRVYQFRDDSLQLLTQDHVHAHPDMKHVLRRAVGMAAGLAVELSPHSLNLHDRFLICSDGVHGPLGARRIAAILAERLAPEEAAHGLVEQASRRGGRDNATALVVDIVGLPPPDQAGLELRAEELPIIELPLVGVELDGFHLESVLSDGRYSRIYLAVKTEDGERVALKFPHPRVTSDAVYRSAFVRESWIAANVRSPFVAEVLEPDLRPRTALYSVMPYYDGETLEQRLSRKPAVAFDEGINIGLKLGKAVYALHRLQIIHRDIKPENIILTMSDGLRLLDLGVARLAGFPELTPADVPGTASYMAPELFAGAAGDELSDVFALGVTLYRMFSGGHYPYGEIEPFTRPRLGSYTSLVRYRPDLPAWIDAVLARTTAGERQDRYGDAMEVVFELEEGQVRGGQVIDRSVPLLERDPVRFWRMISLLLFIALMAALMV